jgi:SdrD B-like domain/Domain of unknown function DUF11
MKSNFMKPIVALLGLLTVALPPTAFAQSASGPDVVTRGQPYSVTLNIPQNESNVNNGPLDCVNQTQPDGQIATFCVQQRTTTSRNFVLNYEFLLNNTPFDASSFYQGTTPFPGVSGTNTRRFAPSLPFTSASETWTVRQSTFSETCTTLTTSLGAETESNTACDEPQTSSNTTHLKTITFNSVSNVVVSANNSISPSDGYNDGDGDFVNVVVTNNGPSDTGNDVGIGFGMPSGWTAASPPGAPGFHSCSTVGCMVAAGFPAGQSRELLIELKLSSLATYLNLVPGTNGTRKIAPTGTSASVGSSVVNVSSGTPFDITNLVQQPDYFATAAPTNTPRGASGSRVYSLKNIGTGVTNGQVTFFVNTIGVLNPSVSGAGWSCGGAVGGINCTTSTTFLPNATLPSVTLNFSVPQNSPDTVSTAGTINGVGDVNLGNNTTGPDETDTVNDLSVALSDGGASFIAGLPGTYQLVVTNNGPSNSNPLDPVNVTLSLPSGVTFETASDLTLVQNSGSTVVLEDTSFNVSVGASKTYFVRVLPNRSASSPMVVSTSVSNANDLIPGNNTSSDSTPLGLPELAVTSSGASIVPLLGSFESVFNVSNVSSATHAGEVSVSGAVDAARVRISSVNGAGWSCSSTASTFSCVRSDDFPANSSRPITVTSTALASGAATVSASISGTNDGSSSNNAAQHAFTVAGPTLELTKAVTGVVQNPDGSALVSFAITARNPNLENVIATISDSLAGLGSSAQIVGAPTLNVVDGGVGGSTIALNPTWNGSSDAVLAQGIIAQDAMVRIEFTVRVLPASSLSNQASAVVVGETSGETTTVDSSPPGIGGGNTGSNNPTPVALPQVGLAKAGSIVNNGDGTLTLNYVITVQNMGSERLENVVVRDDLSSLPGAVVSSAPVVSITVPGAGGSTLSSNAGFNGSSDTALTSGNLAVGATATVSFAVRVTPSASSGSSFVNTATVDAVGADSGLPAGDSSTPGTNPDPSGDGNPINDGGGTSTTFEETTGLSITKSASSVTVSSQGKLQTTITLTVTNAGNTRVSVNVRDALETVYGSSLVSASNVTVSHGVSGSSNLTANPAFGASDSLVASGTVDANSSATVTFVVTLEPLTLSVDATNIGTAAGTTSLGAAVSASSAGVKLDVSRVGSEVFFDEDRDGVRDPNEPALPGVTVVITCNNGNQITTTTDQNGSWSVTVPSGACTVTVDAGDAMTPPPPVVIDPTPGGTVAVPPIGVQADATIRGAVFNDRNGNGSRDAGEAGVSGVTVKVGAFSAVTNAQGEYLLLVTADTHVVTLELPAGFIATTPSSRSVTVALREDASLEAFGVQGRGVVTGTLFADANGNGSRDTGEVTLSGVTITVSSEFGEEKTVQVVDGSYSVDMPLGSVTVSSSVPADFANTTQNPRVVTVNAGSTTADFGFAQQGNVQGIVYQDNNLNGTRDAGEPGVANARVTVTTAGFAVVETTTDASGAYSVITARGLVTVNVTAPQDMKVTSSNNPQTVSLETASVTAEPVGVMFDKGDVSGVVFNDTNGNGSRDAGETGRAGVTVTVQGVGAAVTAITDADGAYRLEVKGTTATITVTPPANLAVSTSNNPQTVAITPNGGVTAAPVGLSAIDVRFSLRVDRSSVEVGSSLAVTASIVNNAPVALGEARIIFTVPAGLTVIASSLPQGSTVQNVNGSSVVTMPVKTLAKGETRDVRFNLTATPALLPSVTITAKLEASSLSTPIPTPISRSAGVRVTRSTAGALGTQTQVTGRVYLDANGNRSFDAGDTPLVGVRLLSSRGQSAVTDANGLYTFPALEAGRVTLRLDPQSAVSQAQVSLFDSSNAITLNLSGGVQVADFALPVGTVKVSSSLETTVTRGAVSVTKRVTPLEDGSVRVELIVTASEAVKALTLTEVHQLEASGFETSLEGATIVNGVLRVPGVIEPGSYTVIYTVRLEATLNLYSLLDFDFTFREVAP